MMKSKIILLVTSLALSGFAFAEAPKEPLNCPAPEAIKAEGLPKAHFVSAARSYVVYNSSNYNMPHNWNFGIGLIKAKKEGRALHKGNKVVQTVSGNPSPIHDKIHDTWVCNYQVKGRYVAVAVTGMPGDLHHIVPRVQ